MCHAQRSLKKSLEKVTTEEQAKDFVKKNKKYKGKIFVFNKEKHNTPITKDLFETPVGLSKTYESGSGKKTYKVLSKEKVTYYRASYIFINSEGISKTELKRLKETIYSKYNQDVPFENLVTRYSMDTNAAHSGDTGWVIEGNMPAEVEKELIKNNKNHYLNKLFTVDIPEKKWSYIILKTEEPKAIDEIRVLRITQD